MSCSASNTIFNVFDLAVGILLLVGGVVSFGGTFIGVVIPIYIILFGSLIILMVFYIPPLLHSMIPFYMNLLGRGFTFLFLGCLVLVGTGHTGVKTVSFVTTLCMAFIYVILWILLKCRIVSCGVPPPFFQSGQGKGAKTTRSKANNSNQQTNDDYKLITTS
eukprot:501150_1